MLKLMHVKLGNWFFILVSLFGLADVSLSKDEGQLVWENVRDNYSNVSEVEIKLRNDLDIPINIDSFQVDFIVVQRRNENNDEWEEGNGFRCGNAGAGTPRAIPSKGIQRIRLLDSAAFGPYGEAVQWFETQQGAKRDLEGRYRILIRYSREPWSDLAHIPRQIDTTKSPEFSVNDKLGK